MPHDKSNLQSAMGIRDLFRRLNKNPNIGIDSRIEDEFQYAVDTARQLVGAEKYALWMLDEDGKLRVKASYGLSDWSRFEHVAGEGVSGTALVKRKSLPIENIDKGRLVNGEVIPSIIRQHPRTETEVKSALSVPLLYGNKVIGCFNAYNSEECPWTKTQEVQMETIAGAVTNAICLADRNERAQNHVAELTHSVVSALVSAFEYKTSWTYQHQERVYVEMVRLGQKLDLPLKIQRHGNYAARLHDLGKFSIGNPVLDKPGPLNEKEWEDIKQHTIRGAKIIGRVPDLSYLVPPIEDHHERLDGSGYPNKKQGDEIGVLARMIGVLDSADAMMYPRPYKFSMPVEICMDDLCMLAKLTYNKDRLVLYRTLENMLKSPKIEDNIKSKIVWSKTTDIFRCFDDHEVGQLADEYKAELKEPAKEQYDPKCVEAYKQILRDRRMI